MALLLHKIAAVALMLDYIVTLAIQSAAGVAAIISTFPALAPWKIPMILVVIVLLTYGNLRGVKEAGKAFAFPTYFFVGSMFIVFAMGIWRLINGTLPVLETDLPGAIEVGEGQGLLTAAAIFILLRAFANGGSSLTGLEAISDGVALFKAPEDKNAKRTLVIMSSLLGTLVLGVSWFAHHIRAMPYESGTPTVISQIAKAIAGDGAFGQFMFIMVQLATMLILFAGANTTYSAFPLLCNFVASDGYLPRQLTKTWPPPSVLKWNFAPSWRRNFSCIDYRWFCGTSCGFLRSRGIYRIYVGRIWNGPPFKTYKTK